MRRIALICALVAAVGLLGGAASAQQRIGVASMTKNEVAGSVGGRTRVIGTGAQVFQNEVVTTGANSSAQLLFRDQTTLTLGSNARMILDKFVYNPSTKTGDIAIDVAEGAFRFMSGDAESQSYSIQTLTATTAVRGTIIAGHVNPLTNQAIIILIEGACEVTTPTSSVLLKPGDYVVINGDGSISGPYTWKGPLLDIDADEQFLYDEQGEVVRPDQPRWEAFNDALQSRDIDTRFPPPPVIEEEEEEKDDEYDGEGGGQFPQEQETPPLLLDRGPQTQDTPQQPN